MTVRCHFAEIPGAGPCRGRLQRAHWLPKQRYKHLAWDDVWDVRAWVPACELHHHRVDNKMLRVPVEFLPDLFFDWVREHGLEAMLSREYGLTLT